MLPHFPVACSMQVEWACLLVARAARHVKKVHELVDVIQFPFVQLLTVLFTLLPRHTERQASSSFCDDLVKLG